MESSVLHFQIQHADEAGEGEGQEEVQTGSSYYRSRNAKGMPICQAHGPGQGLALRVCPFVKLMVQFKVWHTQIKYGSRTGQNTWSFGLISKKKVNIGKLLRNFLNNLKLNFFFLFSGIEA